MDKEQRMEHWGGHCTNSVASIRVNLARVSRCATGPWWPKKALVRTHEETVELRTLQGLCGVHQFLHELHAALVLQGGAIHFSDGLGF